MSLNFTNSKNLGADAFWVLDMFKDGLSDCLKFRTLENKRLAYRTSESQFAVFDRLSPPELEVTGSPYATFVQDQNLSAPLRFMLALSMVNHVLPELLTSELKQGPARWDLHPEIGGVRGQNFPGFIPTGLTFVFLIARHIIQDRIAAQRFFVDHNPLSANGIILLEPHFKGETTLSGKLTIDESWLEFFLGFSELDRSGSIKYPKTRT